MKTETTFKTPIAAMLLALSAILITSAFQPVLAQVKPAALAVVDVQMILRDSKAAKSVRPQIERLRKTYQNAVRKREAELRKASENLQRQRSILSPQAFAKKRGEYESKARNAHTDFQARKRRLDSAMNEAMAKVQQSLIVAAANVAKEKNLDIVIPKSIILLSAKSLDITKEVLARVDKALPSVKVKLPPRGAGKAGAKK